MPRITSLNILLETTGKDYLSELYGRVIENVQKALISNSMKNRELSGDPVSGSVEAKRFANAEPKAYGTARAAGKGDSMKARPVTIAIDQDKEIDDKNGRNHLLDTVPEHLSLTGRIQQETGQQRNQGAGNSRFQEQSCL